MILDTIEKLEIELSLNRYLYDESIIEYKIYMKVANEIIEQIKRLEVTKCS